MQQRALLGVVAVLLTALVSASAQNEPAAVAERLRRHAVDAGLREVAAPTAGPGEVSHAVAGSLGRLHTLLLDLAASEPDLEVTSIDIGRAPDSQRARGATITIRYVVRIATVRDERLALAQWTMPVLVNALLGSSVTAKDLSVASAVVGGGILRLDARSRNRNASSAIRTQLDPGPGKLVRSVELTERESTELVGDPQRDGGFAPRRVPVYDFRLEAKYDPAGVRLDTLKRMAQAE